IRTNIASLSRGVELALELNNAVHGDPSTCHLTVRALGKRPWTIAKAQLLPPRNFLQDSGDSGLDAATIQFCLTQAPRNPVNVEADRAKAENDARAKAAKNATANDVALAVANARAAVPVIGYVPDRSKATIIGGEWSPTWKAVLGVYAKEW